MKLQLAAWALCVPLLVFAQATDIVIDGEITVGGETDWGSPLSTSAGGPAPGFGAGHEINSFYLHETADSLYFFIGGNVQDSNRILLFIDSKNGGYNNGSFDRTDAPEGIDNFNSGTTFDSEFFADYCVVIGTVAGNYFWDLYTLSDTGSNNFLGDTSSIDLAANPADSSETRGFEFRISKTDLGYPTGLPGPDPIQFFLAYISDGGFLSNQFLTPAGPTDGNYGDGSVNFSAAAPNPISVNPVNINLDGEVKAGENWGVPLSTSAGGPSPPGFGTGHEINSFYIGGDAEYFYFFIGGNVQSGNRILLFIDSQDGGYNNGSFDRTDAPEGIDNFNSGTTFDSLFFADYCVVIGIDGGTYTWNLYTLSSTGSNNFLGDVSSIDLAANPDNSSDTLGFEFRISKTDLGYPTGYPAPNPIKVFLAYISDGGFLSNQFLTRANPGQGNFGGGSVNFNSEPPNPITVSESLLPIELISFESEVQQGGVALNWTTASELNNSHFEIERSTDGSNWQVIGQVNGAGNSTTTSNYSYLDTRPSLGVNYYRLKQVDFNGAYAYSEVVSATMRSAGAMSFSPNPANDQLNVPAGVELRISDLTGKTLLYTQTNSNTLDISSLPAGFYMVEMWNGEDRSVQQLVVAK